MVPHYIKNYMMNSQCRFTMVVTKPGLQYKAKPVWVTKTDNLFDSFLNCFISSAREQCTWLKKVGLSFPFNTKCFLREKFSLSSVQVSLYTNREVFQKRGKVLSKTFKNKLSKMVCYCFHRLVVWGYHTHFAFLIRKLIL